MFLKNNSVLEKHRRSEKCITFVVLMILFDLWPDREDEVSKIFISISTVSAGFGNEFYYAERLQISDARRKQNSNQFENVAKSLARFNTQFKVRESLQLKF